MRGRRLAAAALLVVLAGAARPALAREHGVIGAGLFTIQEPSRTAFDEPHFGSTMTVGVLEDRSETWRIRSGFAVQLSTAFGANGLWMGDAWAGYVGTLGLTDEVANPFISFGPTAAYVAPREGEEGVAIGVRGDFGVHGVVLDWLYWRAQIGWVAAGYGGMRSELLVGYAFD